MGVLDLAMIELVADDDYACISGGGFEHRDIKLASDPDDLWSDEFELKIIETAFAPGGLPGGEDTPVIELVLPFNIYDTGQGIEAAVSRFRKLWRRGRAIEWRVTTKESGQRWLKLRRSQGIKFSPARDWNLDGYAKAVVTAVALVPFYESDPLEVTVTNTTAGEHTFWVPVSNPTDQKGWLEWALKPNGEASFAFPDFSFGNEQEIDVKWTPGEHDDRMVVTGDIDVMWSVMSHPLMDTYVAADLSNAAGQMEGVEPLYWVPPWTDEVLVPVIIDGPVGAQVKMTLRRWWSTESGME